jgi:acyl-CoA synthetase (AMP-forming)/AMP-acid ligase II
MIQLLDIYARMAEEQPDRPALIFAREPHVGASWTWSELVERGYLLSRRLAEAGPARGGLWAVVLADHPDLIPVLLAIWRLGGAALLVDPAWGDRLRGSVLAHSEPDAVVSLVPALSIAPLASRRVSDGRALPGDAALLSYTSGSTGDPKAIVMTHARLATTMYAAAAAVVRYRGSPPARIACSMRLSGSGVLNLHYTWAACAGAAVVVLPELALDTAAHYWRRIEDLEIDQMFLVPPLIELLNHVAAPRGGRRPPPTCITGSSPLSPRTQDRFHRRFQVGLLNAYGLTESMCACFFGEYDEHGMGSNCIGMPALLKARVRDAAGAVVEGPGEGELELSGPTLFDGYYRNPAATAAAFVGSWFRTGDLVRRDDGGRYWIMGRSKDVVMKGGFAVYLIEVEEAALDVPGIHEAAAVPLTLPDGSEDIGLIVRALPDTALDLRAVSEGVGSRLGAQRMPRRVVETTAPLPRTGQEKLDRRRVLELWQALCAAGATPGATL